MSPIPVSNRSVRRDLFWLGAWLLLVTISSSNLAAQPPAQRESRPALEGDVAELVFLGAPSQDKLLIRKRYVLAYDFERRVPRWVAYRVRGSDAPPVPPFVPRRPALVAPQAVGPESFLDEAEFPQAAKLADYAGVLLDTGFAAGRLAPWNSLTSERETDADRERIIAHARSMLLTAPMHKLGFTSRDGLWSQFHEWLEWNVGGQFEDVWVVTGPVLGDRPLRRLGNSGLWVPPAFFAVVAVPGEKPGDLQVIAFVLPHASTPRGRLGDYAVSVDTVEAMTGLDFFPDLDNEIEEWKERLEPRDSWHGPPPELARGAFPMMAAPAPAMDSVPVRRPDAIHKIEAAPKELAPAPRAIRKKENGSGTPPPIPAPPTKPLERVVRVFYGTNRQVDEPDEPNKHYGRELGPLELGYCDVNIPPNKPPGELPRPLLESFPEKLNEHVVLLTVTPRSRDEFTTGLRDRVQQSSGKEAFVFIHGYNNSFADAARRTAQMAYDLRLVANLDLAPVMFSWPSQEETFGYYDDQATVEASIDPLIEFLDLVAEKSGASRIHLIAHSMGSELLRQVLTKFASRSGKSKFHQIILAAPDISKDDFLNTIAPQVARVSERMTIYSSRRDKALLASRAANLAARVGYEPVTLAANDRNIEQVDATLVDTSVIGHAYYGDEAPVLLDIADVLQAKKPGERRLRKHSYYFEFPIDGASLGWGVFLDPKVLAVVAGLALVVVLLSVRSRRRHS